MGWSSSRRRRAAVLAALALAVEGVFVRRTGVPDDDAITLVTIPLAALVVHCYAISERPAWLVVAGSLLVALPLTHTFSTLIAALVLLALVAGYLVGRPLTRGTLGVVALVGGFAAYFVGYYAWAGSETQLVVPYVDRVQSSPGLFLAWLIVLVVFVPWFQRTSRRLRRAVAFVPLVVVFGVIAVNARVVVFPGTAATPRIVLWLVLPLAVPAVLAAVGAHRFGRIGPVEPVLLAMFVAPIIQILFSLTAGLTPEYFATALRAQTHFHLPVLVLASGVVADLHPARDALRSRSGRLLARYGRPAIVVLFVFTLVATLPVAYVNLDTGSYPSTTTESEFAAGTFSARYLAGQWTSSHTQVRIPANYFGGVNASVSPAASWLRGGPVPDCPVVAQRSWTTTGAHLFPGAPETIEPNTYRRWKAERSLVYAAGGHDPIVVTVPRGDTGTRC